MQYLNSLLCLNTLQQLSWICYAEANIIFNLHYFLSFVFRNVNCCILFRNDRLLEDVNTKTGDQIENMNFYIASCLGDIYIPNESVSYRYGLYFFREQNHINFLFFHRGVKYFGTEPSEMLDVLAPDPSYKFLSANTANRLALSKRLFFFSLPSLSTSNKRNKKNF